MNNKWKIGTTDLYASLGVVLLKGSYTEILSPPIPKKRIEHDYPDKDGVSVDTTSTVVYEAKRFKIPVAISGATSAAFWSHYESFFALIDIPGEFSLYVADLGLTVNLLYEGAKCINKPSSLKSGSVWVVYELSLLEADPTNRAYD